MDVGRSRWRREWRLPLAFLVWAATSAAIWMYLHSTCGAYHLLRAADALERPLRDVVLRVFTWIPFAYTCLLGILLWRYSSSGSRRYRLIAGISCLVVLLAAATGLYSDLTFDVAATIDASRNSRSIAEHLHATPEHPLVGLWKNSCNLDFGLAILEAGDGIYAVVFCGPGGCGRPAANQATPILGDRRYELIDEDTIRVDGCDGHDVYKRCT